MADLGFINEFVLQYSYFGLFGLLVLGALGFPFPEDLVLILTGALIADGTVKAVPAVIVVYIGLLITDSFLYYLGRKFGVRVVRFKMFRRILPEDRLLRLEAAYSRSGIWFILLGRHFIGMRTKLFLVSGIMRMPYLKFLATDGFTSVLTLALMLYIGYMGRENWENIKAFAYQNYYLALPAGAAVLIVVILFYIRRRRRARAPKA
jgi:membrane protein DedA with SNARE-associated domain